MNASSLDGNVRRAIDFSIAERPSASTTISLPNDEYFAAFESRLVRICSTRW